MDDLLLIKTSELENKLSQTKEKLRRISETRETYCKVKDLKLTPPNSIYKPRFYPDKKSISHNVRIEFLEIIKELHFYFRDFSNQD